MTRAQEAMALAAVAGALDLPPRQRTSGATCDSRIQSAERAARVFILAFYFAFGIPTAACLIILALLIDWQGVIESLESLF